MAINPEDEREFVSAIGRAVELSKKRLVQNPNDLRALYSLGIAYGLRANYVFLVRRDWVRALRDATNARKLHNRLTQLDPSNVDAHMMQGIHDYIVGSLPLSYRILGFLTGFHGDRAAGIRTIETVGREGRLNRIDAKVFLVAIYRREHRANDAIPLLQELIDLLPRNHLLRFELVQMYGDTGDKAHAQAAVDTIRSLKEQAAVGFAEIPEAKIDFLEGNLLFWFGDAPRAIEDLKKVAAEAGNVNLATGVMSWLRLGQAYDLESDHPSAVDAYRQVIRIAPQSQVAREARGYIASAYSRKTKAA
jgi:tetratricopeptide (TPR) repeat protein